MNKKIKNVAISALCLTAGAIFFNSMKRGIELSACHKTIKNLTEGLDETYETIEGQALEIANLKEVNARLLRDNIKYRRALRVASEVMSEDMKEEKNETADGNGKS